MRGAPDQDRSDGRSSPPGLIDDDSRAVGFLDLPDLDADSVMERILDGFSQLDDDAVLTAYCTRVDTEAIEEICRSHGVQVVHSVAHEAGTTFVMKQPRSPNRTPH